MFNSKFGKNAYFLFGCNPLLNLHIPALCSSANKAVSKSAQRNCYCAAAIHSRIMAYGVIIKLQTHAQRYTASGVPLIFDLTIEAQF